MVVIELTRCVLLCLLVCVIEECVFIAVVFFWMYCVYFGVCMIYLTSYLTLIVVMHVCIDKWVSLTDRRRRSALLSRGVCGVDVLWRLCLCCFIFLFFLFCLCVFFSISCFVWRSNFSFSLYSFDMF